MLFSDLSGKPVYCNSIFVGLCTKISFSTHHELKTVTVSPTNAKPFTVRSSNIANFSKHGITLFSTQKCKCPKLNDFNYGVPVYNEIGNFCGNISDLEISDKTYILIKFICDNNFTFSPANITAYGDAVIIKKSVYPIGIHVPNGSFVTKTNLKEAINKGTLISFTRSLSPFTNSL